MGADSRRKRGREVPKYPSRPPLQADSTSPEGDPRRFHHVEADPDPFPRAPREHPRPRRLLRPARGVVPLLGQRLHLRLDRDEPRLDHHRRHAHRGAVLQARHPGGQAAVDELPLRQGRRPRPAARPHGLRHLGRGNLHRHARQPADLPARGLPSPTTSAPRRNGARSRPSTSIGSTATARSPRGGRRRAASFRRRAGSTSESRGRAPRIARPDLRS